VNICTAAISGYWDELAKQVSLIGQKRTIPKEKPHARKTYAWKSGVSVLFSSLNKPATNDPTLCN